MLVVGKQFKHFFTIPFDMIMTFKMFFCNIFYFTKGLNPRRSRIFVAFHKDLDKHHTIFHSSSFAQKNEILFSLSDKKTLNGQNRLPQKYYELLFTILLKKNYVSSSLSVYSEEVSMLSFKS